MRFFWFFLLLLIPFWAAAISITADCASFFPCYTGDLEDYKKDLAAQCDMVSGKFDVDGDSPWFVNLYAIDLLLHDAAEWADTLKSDQEFFYEKGKMIAPDVNWLNYDNFKRVVHGDTFKLGIFALQECGCMMGKIMPLNISLCDQVDFSVLNSSIANVPRTRALCMTDVGSGDLLPLFRRLNELAKRGYKNFVVNAVDLRYERLIANYKKVYTPDAYGVYHITHDFKPLFSEDEQKDITVAFQRVFSDTTEPALVDLARNNLNNSAYLYQINSALFALLSWAYYEHVDISFNIYATVAEYLEDFERKKLPQNDIITAIDVGIASDDNLLRDFDELRLKTLAPGGLEIFLAHADIRKPDDGAELFGFDTSVPSKTTFTLLEQYFHGIKDRYEMEGSADSASVVEMPEEPKEFPVLFAFGGSKSEDLAVTMVDGKSGYLYWPSK